MGREFGYESLTAAVEQALDLGCGDVAAIRHRLMSDQLQHTVGEPIEIGALSAYERPLPTMIEYDRLLQGCRHEPSDHLCFSFESSGDFARNDLKECWQTQRLLPDRRIWMEPSANALVTASRRPLVSVRAWTIGNIPFAPQDGHKSGALSGTIALSGSDVDETNSSSRLALP
jgi:hypothetical protein